ncbi:hypothetical protein BM1_09991 [Bipolaris maydis]|nr:hypothetical protein BM1_09991 [Bipolaris maydis]
MNMGIFTPRPRAPPLVESDTVIRVHSLDDVPHHSAMAMDLTLSFHDVLSPDKLKSSLEILINLEGWRKLGARCRRNATGKLEYHIPSTFTLERPAFLFASSACEGSIRDHPAACQLSPPGSLQFPAVHPISTAALHDFATHPNHPHKLEDWLYTDRPLLSVSVVTFADATLLTLGWSHIVMDIGGYEALMKSWIAVLNGREENVLPFVGFSEDPIANLAVKESADSYLLFPKTLTGWGFLRFVFNYFCEKIFYPLETDYVVSIPQTFVQGLKEEATQYLERCSPSLDTCISDGDILCALMTKLTISSQSLSEKRTVHQINVFDLRGILEDAFPKDACYMGNACLSASTFFTVDELLNQPLAATALRIRESLQQQRILPQIHASIALRNQLSRRPILGPADQIFVPFSNWHKFRLCELDFRAAIVGRDGGSRARVEGDTLGRPYLVKLFPHKNNIVRISTFQIGLRPDQT